MMFNSMLNTIRTLTGSSSKQPHSSEKLAPFTFEEAAQELNTTPEELQKLINMVDYSAQEYKDTGKIPKNWHSLDKLVREIKRDDTALPTS